VDRRIDLNADLGEGMPGERAILELITTANLAAGGHAGGGEILRRSVRDAIDRGVVIGAHPSYPDREHFGRVSRLEAINFDDLVVSLIDQITAVAELAPLHHVKPHGALYNDAVVDDRAASAILASMRAFDDALPVMTMGHGVLAREAKAQGRPVISEVFADRAYSVDGSLVPRGIGGAVLDSADEIVARMVRFLETGLMSAADGEMVALAGESICIHGDTPHAVEVAKALRTALVDAGFEIKAH
jgi:UPF0271 protein